MCQRPSLKLAKTRQIAVCPSMVPLDHLVGDDRPTAQRSAASRASKLSRVWIALARLGGGSVGGRVCRRPGNRPDSGNAVTYVRSVASRLIPPRQTAAARCSIRSVVAVQPKDNNWGRFVAILR